MSDARFKFCTRSLPWDRDHDGNHAHLEDDMPSSRTGILIGFAFGLLTATTAVEAQEADARPSSDPLAALQRLIGNFKGSGKTWDSPSAQPTTWTAQMACRRILNDTALIEETLVNLGEGAPAPLAIVRLIGYDREAVDQFETFD